VQPDWSTGYVDNHCACRANILNSTVVQLTWSSVPATAAPTQAPTTAPTQAPTTAPTQAPTTAPTRAPTPVPTKAPTSCQNSLVFTQVAVSSWVSNGQTFTEWSVSVATTVYPMYDVELVLTLPSKASVQSYWGLSTTNTGSYNLQDWRLQSGQAVPPGTTITFGYIANSAHSSVIVASIAQCVPPPKNCNVTVTEVLQSSYFDGHNYNAVFNFVFTNIGTSGTNTLDIDLSLTTGAYPSQFWNLVTSDTKASIIQSKAVGFTASLYGIAPGQSSSSSGYILTSPVPISAAPTFSIVGYTCS